MVFVFSDSARFHAAAIVKRYVHHELDRFRAFKGAGGGGVASAVEQARAARALLEKHTRAAGPMWLGAIGTVVEDFSGADLETAIEAGASMTQVSKLAADQVDFGKIKPAFTRSIHDAIADAGAVMRKQVTSKLLPDAWEFDPLKPNVVAWASEHAGDEITLINETSKQAIRDTVTRNLTGELSTKDTVRRIKANVGLTARDAGACDRAFAADLEAGKPLKVAQDRAMKYADRLRTARAKMISQNEAHMSVAQGRRMAFEQIGEEFPELSTRRATREWLAAADEATCFICGRIDGTKVPFDQPFVLVTGERVMVAHAHGRCRCTECISYAF